jgi:hypothetical protein
MNLELLKFDTEDGIEWGLPRLDGTEQERQAARDWVAKIPEDQLRITLVLYHALLTVRERQLFKALEWTKK